MTILTHDLASDYRRAEEPKGQAVTALKADASAKTRKVKMGKPLSKMMKLIDEHNQSGESHHRHRNTYVQRSHKPTKKESKHAHHMHTMHQNAFQYMQNVTCQNYFKLDVPVYLSFQRSMFDNTLNVFL